jgi:hypothetical protein
MIHIMENKSDLKNLSLQLYGKEVEVTLKEGSTTFKLFNKSSLTGLLTGRHWGNKLIKDDQHEETVIAITLRAGKMDLEIPLKDIQDLYPQSKN